MSPHTRTAPHQPQHPSQIHQQHGPHNAAPNGYWHYNQNHVWEYSPWVSEQYYHYEYDVDVHYHYYQDNHFYWSYDPYYHYYPDYWDTYVYVVPPTESAPVPTYSGPKLDVSDLESLVEAKWAVDQMRADLNKIAPEDRGNDDYRFAVMDVLNSYHYLIKLVYEYASEHGRKYANRTGDHRDPVYQKAVRALWDASLEVLAKYEFEFPYDTAMRGDSVTVLYSSLSKTDIIEKNHWAKRNDFYADLYSRIGMEVPI